MRSGWACAAALAVMVAAAPVRADEPPSLRTLLSSAPLAVLDSMNEAFLVNAVNLAAVRTLAGDGTAVSTDVVRRLAVGSTIRPMAEWRLYSKLDVWDKQVGIAPSRIDAFVGYGRPPGDTAVWVLRDDASAKALFEGLPQRGFSAADDGMLANGAPGALDLKNRRPGDPWRGSLGKTSVVALQGRTVIQASSPPPIAAARKAAAANVTSHAAVDVVLRGIERLSADGARVAQALLLSPVVGVGSLDPAALLEGTPNIDEMRKKIEALAARDKATGLPVYAMMLIADIEVPGKSRGAAVVLAHVDCAQAALGGKRFVERWRTIPSARARKPLAEIVPARTQTDTVAGAQALCAAVVTLTQDVPASGDDLRNKPLEVVLQAIMNRDFAAATMATP